VPIFAKKGKAVKKTQEGDLKQLQQYLKAEKEKIRQLRE